MQYHHDLPWVTLRSRSQTWKFCVKFFGLSLNLLNIMLKDKVDTCMLIDIGLVFYAVHHNSPG